MPEQDIGALTERAKELECLYAVDEVLQNAKLSTHEAMHDLTRVIPSGFAYPDACRVKITLDGIVFAPGDYSAAAPQSLTPLEAEGQVMGEIEVGVIRSLLPEGTPAALLDKEVQMMRAIARRVSYMTLSNRRELSLLFDMLHRVDPDMLLRVCEKLEVHLGGIVGADLNFLNIPGYSEEDYGEVNALRDQRGPIDTDALVRALVSAAARFLPIGVIFELFDRWIQDERLFSLVRIVNARDAGVPDVLDAVKKYLAAAGTVHGGATETWLIVELARRFLTNDERLINLVLEDLSIASFVPLLENIICSGAQEGNIGGKGAGLFIADQILKNASANEPLLAGIKTPRTWYIAAEQFSDFMISNRMEEMNAYKYNSMLHLRMTYDSVAAQIKSAALPSNVTRMLNHILSDMGDVPLIVRSSSILEDRHGAAFAGKYKSLFLPNVGNRESRLEKLTLAVLEVYSSLLNPDSIQYRRERSLLNSNEQMGILIQEVVGRRVGPYYMPLYAGVAFSQNLYRWSPRVERDGGLVRMVMGLGTRAVDRVNDDYPCMFSPARPELKVNQSPHDVRYYSQKCIDLLNLERNRFETLDAAAFLREYGRQVPGLHKLVSVYTRDFMQRKNAFDLNPEKDDMVITLDGIITDSNLPARIKRMLDVLGSRMDTPVDIEFASDGESLYLLQCRPQGMARRGEAARIPASLKDEDILFTASKYVTNARIEGITHIVYVDGAGYAGLPTREQLVEAGRAVGLLGGMLPKRKFILIGPGRWGSRGDIQLGVRVTYSDICNCAALIEVARENSSYVPELSFGTHFFQDLVEGDIAYLPLYPDSYGAVFRESFFLDSPNLLPELLPQYAHLAGALKVIDVPAVKNGMGLALYMNSDREEAAAFFAERSGEPEARQREEPRESGGRASPDRDAVRHWRRYMAEQIAADMDMDALGVKGVYLFGSTIVGNAEKGSDIDLLVHVSDDPAKRPLAEKWLDGWSRALAKSNFLLTGYETGALLDVHYVTDSDIAEGGPFASKIGSATDPAVPLRVGETEE